MELDARAQMEGVFAPVLGHVPAFRQPRHGPGGAGGELDQPVVERLRGGIEGRAGDMRRRVEALGILGRAEGEVLGMSGHGRAGDEHRRRQDQRHRFHRNLIVHWQG